MNGPTDQFRLGILAGMILMCMLGWLGDLIGHWLARFVEKRSNRKP